MEREKLNIADLLAKSKTKTPEELREEIAALRAARHRPEPETKKATRAKNVSKKDAFRPKPTEIV